jgi:hypothetical protein
MDKPVKVFLNVMVDGRVVLDIATNKREYALAYMRNYGAKNRKLLLEKDRNNIWTCPHCNINIQTRNIKNHNFFWHSKEGHELIMKDYKILWCVPVAEQHNIKSYNDYYVYRVNNLKRRLIENNFAPDRDYTFASQPTPPSSSYSP